MKTTSIYTLFFSPTGTSRRIAAAVAQGMAGTKGRATRASAGDNTAPEPPAGQTPEAGTAAAAPEPAAGNRGETASVHGAPAVTAIDLTYPAGQPAPLPAGAVAIFAVPVYGRHVAPAALERLREIRGEGTPAIVLTVYGNRSFGTAVAELASFVAERGHYLSDRESQLAHWRNRVGYSRNKNFTASTYLPKLESPVHPGSHSSRYR